MAEYEEVSFLVVYQKDGTALMYITGKLPEAEMAKARPHYRLDRKTVGALSYLILTEAEHLRRAVPDKGLN